MYALSQTSCEQREAEAPGAVERAKVVAAGEFPAYLFHLWQLGLIMNANGMLFVYNASRGAFVNSDNFAYDEVAGYKLYDFGLDWRLDFDEVRLPRNSCNLPGY